MSYFDNPIWYKLDEIFRVFFLQILRGVWGGSSLAVLNKQILDLFDINLNLTFILQNWKPTDESGELGQQDDASLSDDDDDFYTTRCRGPPGPDF